MLKSELFSAEMDMFNLCDSEYTESGVTSPLLLLLLLLFLPSETINQGDLIDLIPLKNPFSVSASMLFPIMRLWTYTSGSSASSMS